MPKYKNQTGLKVIITYGDSTGGYKSSSVPANSEFEFDGSLFSIAVHKGHFESDPMFIKRVKPDIET